MAMVEIIAQISQCGLSTSFRCDLGNVLSAGAYYGRDAVSVDGVCPGGKSNLGEATAEMRQKE